MKFFSCDKDANVKFLRYETTQHNKIALCKITKVSTMLKRIYYSRGRSQYPNAYCKSTWKKDERAH